MGHFFLMSMSPKHGKESPSKGVAVCTPTTLCEGRLEAQGACLDNCLCIVGSYPRGKAGWTGGSIPVWIVEWSLVVGREGYELPECVCSKFEKVPSLKNRLSYKIHPYYRDILHN